MLWRGILGINPVRRELIKRGGTVRRVMKLTCLGLAAALLLSVVAPTVGQEGTGKIEWLDGKEIELDKKSRKDSTIFQDFDVLSGKKKKEPIMIYFFWPRPVEGFMDKDGKITVETKLDDAKSLAEGMMPAKSGGKWGFADNKTGKLEIEAKYSDAKSFCDGLAAVRAGNKWGFVDKAGKAVVEAQYEDAGSFSDGLAPVKAKGKWRFIDKTGKVVIEVQFNDAGSFGDGLAPVKVGGKWGFIDKTGKTVIEPKFDEAERFSEGLAPVREGRKWGFVDKAGKLVITAQFDDAESFSDGLAVVKVKGRWGFTDKAGKMVIKPTLEGAKRFSDGLAPVKVDGRWRYVDKRGAKAIHAQFGVAGSFSDGLAYVKTHSRKPKKKENQQVKLCEEMESGLFKDNSFVGIADEFICVKVRLMGFPRDLAKKYKLKYAPYILIFDCLGKKVGKITNPKPDSDEVIALLIDLRDMVSNSDEKRNADE